jgi:cytochrome b involved in lipid metabolism
MAIEGNVYDATKFIPSHPGDKAILNGCGKDATVLFHERPTNDRGPHPAQAKAALDQFYIGELKQ